MPDSNLLVNLVLALLVGLIGSGLAVRLGQSVVLGYILAGIAIGPYTPGFVGDIVTVEALADIGIILLLFTIGLRFSLRSLLEVGRVAIVGGTIQVLLTMGVGYLAGRALGWSTVEATFFGAVLSNSSSTVLTKVLSERGELDTLPTRIALAWSSVQDFGTIVLLVFLTALATGDGLGAGLVSALLRAALFLALLLPVGLWILPRVFRLIVGLKSREVFIVAIAATALGTAYVSSFFGLSLALGAFAAGVILGECDLSDELAGTIEPLRDVFTGLFFVSVGMLFDPRFVLEQPVLVVVAVAMFVLVKGAITYGVALLNRCSPATSLFVAITLAQSAEFSFLMARVGVRLQAMSTEVFSLILAAASISIMLAPILHRVGAPVIRRLEER